MQPWKCGHLLCTAMVSILEYLHILLFTRLTITYCLKDFHVRFLWSRKVDFCDRWLYPWYQAPPQLHLNIYQIESVQDFLIKLDIKPLMHLLEISTLSLNNVIIRLTKIMNRADKNWAHFYKKSFKKLKIFRNSKMFSCWWNSWKK